MIVNRLYELAQRESLLDDPAFETLPVPYVIKLDASGGFLGIEERRGTVQIPSRKKEAPPKTKPDKGIEIPVPKAHGNTANRGFARFFVDTLARVVPITDDDKSANSRATFWEQMRRAAAETDDPALRAAVTFGERLASDTELVQQIRGEIESQKASAGDRCTFAWAPDGGAVVVLRDTVRHWYRGEFGGLAAAREEAGPQGFCQVTGDDGPLARSHATKLVGVPGGLPTGVSLVSYDKAAFESYGLDGAANAGIGYRAAEGYSRALNALLANKLPHFPQTCLKVGGVAFLFWTREPQDTGDIMQLERPDSTEVARLIQSATAGRERHSIESRDFYCLCLSGNAARAIVREYIELPIADARANLGRWFADLRIVDHFTSEPKADFPLWMLANATVRSGDDVPPGLPATLMSAALKGTRVPGHVLAACLRRIHVESGASQFNAARMGLIKLIVNRNTTEGESKMAEKLDGTTPMCSPGYACGQLLALLARCQSTRDFGAGAQILERYFGSASTAPRAVFPILLRLNRHHLRKIRDDMPGFAFNLEEDLEQRLAPFRGTASTAPDFPAVLSLPEQGRFALGFYHQRASYRSASADRKAAEAATAAEEQAAR